MQASAIGVLEEVKRKKADIKKLLEIAEAIMELRTLRREASRKKGVIFIILNVSYQESPSLVC